MRNIPNDEHLKFNQPNTWIPLFEVNAGGSLFYFTPNPEAVFIQGQTYTPMPIALQELKELSTGEVPNVQLIASNLDNSLAAAIKAVGSIDGEKIVYKILVIPKVWCPVTTYALGDKVYSNGHIYECTDAGKSDSVEPTWNNAPGSVTIDNPGGFFEVQWTEDSAAADNVIFEETLEIISVGPITEETITFEVGAFNPYTVKLLQEKYQKNFCWNTYKGDGCWIKQPDGTYTQPHVPSGGAWAASCDKTLGNCKANSRENTKRFNAFPTLTSSGGRFV